MLSVFGACGLPDLIAYWQMLHWVHLALLKILCLMCSPPAVKSWGIAITEGDGPDCIAKTMLCLACVIHMHSVTCSPIAPSGAGVAITEVDGPDSDASSAVDANEHMAAADMQMMRYQDDRDNFTQALMNLVRLSFSLIPASMQGFASMC